MSEASFASLGPTLLARKGGAKPAMRPQLAPLPGVVPPEAADQLEDLGWNDMGSEAGDETSTDEHSQAETSANVVSLATEQNIATNDDTLGSDIGIVHQQQQRLAKHILAEANGSDEAPPKKASTKTKRAAFTLRLDKERHLKLRLAATMQGMSAQALVTQALDATLAKIDDLDAIADRFSGQIKQTDTN